MAVLACGAARSVGHKAPCGARAAGESPPKSRARLQRSRASPARPPLAPLGQHGARPGQRDCRLHAALCGSPSAARFDVWQDATDAVSSPASSIHCSRVSRAARRRDRLAPTRGRLLRDRLID